MKFLERNRNPIAESKVETEASSTAAMADPVLSAFELPLSAIFHPLGFTLEITTNSQDVLDCAEESWGHFRKLFSEPPVKLQIGVLEDGSESRRSPIPVCRARANLLVNIADAENFTVCDIRQGFAFGWVTQAVVADRAHFRYNFLEGAVWTLVKSLYLTPLHAAIVKLADRGVLLCGDAGAGKSSLAFSCARRGWTFLSDDSACLVRNRNDRLVLGNPYQMRFRETGLELFPELRKYPLTRRLAGEMAIEISTVSMPEIATALTSTIDYIVFLNRRGPGFSRLAPFPKKDALTWFEKVICFGERDMREAQIASLRRLLAVPTYELHYRDLDWAVDRLEALVRKGV